MYDLILSDKSKEQLKKLSKNLQDRIGAVFERIRIRPFHFVKRKQGTPHFILRIGEYRAILDIKNKKLIILVLEIGPRKKIYK
jgi:mRNA interferase RelE/StbE